MRKLTNLETSIFDERNGIAVRIHKVKDDINYLQCEINKYDFNGEVLYSINDHLKDAVNAFRSAVSVINNILIDEENKKEKELSKEAAQ